MLSPVKSTDRPLFQFYMSFRNSPQCHLCSFVQFYMPIYFFYFMLRLIAIRLVPALTDPIDFLFLLFFYFLNIFYSSPNLKYRIKRKRCQLYVKQPKINNKNEGRTTHKYTININNIKCPP